MAKNNLEYAAAMLRFLQASSPMDYQRVSEKTSLSENEPVLWIKAAAAMCLPYDKELNIHAQDDSFLQKERWNFSDPKLNKHPLLLHLHPLVIYRYQILKQPDVVLANFLQNERFTRIEKMRDYDYYNPITTGDSSLAPCIQSIMAAELGRVDEAYGYFMKTARMDLDDINSNVCDGIHVAAMGGTWLSIVYGFAGLRDYGDLLSFCPRLPSAWKFLNFKLKYRGNILSIRIDHEKAVYTLIEGLSLKISHMGLVHTIRSATPVELSMRPVLKAVIFDLDGVITDTSEFHFLAWKKLADEEGYTFSRAINERLRGIGRLESLDIILDSSAVRLSPEERFSQGERKNEYYKQMLQSIGPDNILPGVKSFIASLKERKIRTALASASRNAPEVIKKLGIAADFDIVMDAAAVSRGKPDPEIFVSAAEALNVYPEQCAGVEDAAAGVEAIKAAGIFSIGIGEAAKAADWSLDSTADLKLDELLKRFGG
jgi:alpha,alpha-trehalose phosphorylase